MNDEWKMEMESDIYFYPLNRLMDCEGAEEVARPLRLCTSLTARRG